jgi:hypothetical protein
MILLILVALTGAVVLLTVAFLGTLRGLAEMRLRLAGHDFTGLEPMRVDPGRPLPDELKAAFPAWTAGPGGILFLADDCPTCLRLASELGSFLHADRLLVCHVAGPGTAIRERLPAAVTEIPEPVAAGVLSGLNVTMTPVVVLQQDGYIVARGVADGAETLEAIAHLWSVTFGGGGDGDEDEDQQRDGGDRWALISKAN